MRKAKVCVVAVALLALLAGAAQAEVYVEGYIGANFAANVSGPVATALPFIGPIGYGMTPHARGNIDPAFLGGLKIGTWFVKEGFLGYNYPEWMKYFGFYLDFSYHRLNAHESAGTIRPLFLFPIQYAVSSEGAAATLAFMFAFRYGLLPDREVPFGRLQPYVAIGPAIMWTWQQPTFKFWPFHPASTWTVKPDSQSTTMLALAVEAGLRWMALKNVSIDLSFKYRRAHPTFTWESPSYVLGPPYVDKFHFSAPYNLYSINLGAAYHF